MNTTPSSSQELNHDQVAALAYRFYVENGRQDGHATADWLRAEQTIAAQKQHTAAPAGHEAKAGHEFHAPVPPGKGQPPLAERGREHSATDRDVVRQHRVHPAARHQ